MDIQSIKQQAIEELHQELFRDAVEKYKIKLRSKKSFWRRIFPFKIMFINLNKQEQ